MKKTFLLFFLFFMSLVSAVQAEHSETDLENSIHMLFSWQDENATVRNFPGSIAADYYIMSLAHMDSDYNFKSYINLTENINPPTKQDGQRLVMSNAACGEKLSDSFVGWYTYNTRHDNASDLAGAIITLDSGGYKVKSTSTDINNMVCDLLSMQQENGSFSNDILTTAKAIIALSPRKDAQYKFKGTNTGEEYGYNCKDAIHNAVLFLGASQKSDGGYLSVMNTAYVIMALNSININADNNSMFIKNNLTPLDYIISNIGSDGSVYSLADDTALSSAALVSQLNFMRSKASFFNFTKTNLSDKPTNQPELIMETETQAPQTSEDTSQPSIIEVSPPPTKAPEHSAVIEEQYGPLPFVGPVYIEKDEAEDKITVPHAEDREGSGINITGFIIAVLTALISIAGFAYLTVLKTKPQSLEKLILKFNYVFRKKKGYDINTDNVSSDENYDFTDELYNTPEVVSKEELYDPDFVKKLIPVDEIDSSIDSILSDDT